MLNPNLPIVEFIFRRQTVHPIPSLRPPANKSGRTFWSGTEPATRLEALNLGCNLPFESIDIIQTEMQGRKMAELYAMSEIMEYSFVDIIIYIYIYTHYIYIYIYIYIDT